MLTLIIQTYRNEPLPQRMTTHFDQLGGSIGRSSENTLVLDDPSKYISRLHATVDFKDGFYVLTDIGSNPSIVNERPLGKGRRVSLNDKDHIVIGDYRLEVNVSSVDASSALMRSPVLDSPIQDIPLQLQSTPLFDLGNDSLASASILNFDASDGHPNQVGFDPVNVNQLAPQIVIPDNFSLVRDNFTNVPVFRGTENDHASPETQPFALPSAHASQEFPPEQLVPPLITSGAVLAIPEDYDPLTDFMPARAESLPHSHHLNTESTPESPFATPKASSILDTNIDAHHQLNLRESVQTVPPLSDNSHKKPTKQSETNDEVIQALLKGLGLSELKLDVSPAAFAELVGASLREATIGTMSVLSARTMTKRESRLEMTMIMAKSNNPLKFFPDAKSALTQMLTNGMDGYMPAERSFQKAFDDLKAHEFAVLAGMRAALTGVLKRFDPIAIEKQLKVPTVMDKMLSSNRKAKMWDGMVDLYEKISIEADDDFQRIFGEQFAIAYEEQIQRLRNEK